MLYRHATMRLRCSAVALAWALGHGACAGANMGTPQAGQDYFSWQIASGDPSALRQRMQQYSALPFVRIERRGELHVLRAGMWASASDARTALARTAPTQALIRIATYRPETILHRNWSDDATSTASAAPAPQAPSDPAALPRANRPPPSGPDVSMRAFNQEDYALAFEVFLGSGDLQRALRVASQAVAHVPGNTDWRRKLARVADWANQPLVAWEHWHYLLKSGDKSAETTTAVLRLAPLSGHSEVAVEVWKLRAQQQALSAAQWQDLLRMFEEGDQIDMGSQYFEDQFRRWGDTTLLEYAARLAYNTGDDARALQLYRERVVLQPFSLDSTLRAVLLLLRADRLREAFVLMQDQGTSVPPEMDEFWRIFGNTAWDLRETEAAEKAYRAYTQSSRATPADWSRLVYLARQQSPQAGADLALDAYRRWGRLDDLLLAMGIYAQIPDAAGQARALGMLNEKDLELAQQQPGFLLLRAQYFQQQGNATAALDDYRRAQALAPQDSQAGLALLWFLIDQRRKPELQPLLRQLEPQWRDHQDYWLAFAAARLALEQPREALPWLQKVVHRQPDDGLLLLNYADTLQAVGRVGVADRVRRHAWLKLRAKVAQQGSGVPTDKQAALLAWVRLQLQNQNADANMRMVRETVSHLRGLDDSAWSEREQMQNLVLSWAISNSQFENARSWMWLQQARSGSKPGFEVPVWAQSQVSLQLGDEATMQDLLDKRGASMPLYNRYDTAYALGHESQALALVFESMLRQGDDQNLHERHRQHAPLAASYLQLRVQGETAGEQLDTSSQQLEAAVQVAPGAHLLLGWSGTLQSTLDTTLSTLMPTQQRLASVGLRWQTRTQSTQVQLFHREELSTQLGVALEHSQKWDQRVLLSLGLGYRADASDSVALRVGGSQNLLQLGVNYTIDKRIALRWGTRWTQYYTQHGDALGEGSNNDLELGYRLRLEYPDVRLRLYASDQSYSYQGPAQGAAVLAPLPSAFGSNVTAGGIDPIRYFLPNSATTWGACMDFGETLSGHNVQQTYTRALRPFSQLCALDQSRTGAGYSAAIGLAGAVLGPDHLSLRLEQNEGGLGNLGGTLSRAWALRYRHYF